ncbi:phosphatase [Paenibacillus sp. J23TS9]|uniref:histidine phosphatase family protein n=1 Tax=Paenibacillus sp. J23TS9 TaxID=2807193 RepID=UPI001B125971|nr:histidine phosphatase family protein [Paenibacillus sp. J23TS9]GIP26144.1 phosphatase [Paenibacillus sp. J23TS9]
MSTRLYLTRHGETEWNVVHRMQGEMDSPLTELGVHQAESLKAVLDTVHIDVIYASPSPRAMRTTEILRGEREIPLIASESLMEMRFGIWEGQVHSEVQTHYPEQWDRFWNNPEEFAIANSETYAQVRTRALNLLNEIIRKHSGESLLIVTHTIVIKLLMAHYQGTDLKQLWKSTEIQPASLSRVDISGKTAKIVLHGDTSHYPLP